MLRTTGGGVPPDLLPRVFDPHVSGGKSKGAGIGLAVARSIAEEHEGKLILENAPKGARAVFTLPATPEGESDNDSEQETRNERHEADEDIGG